MVQSFDIVVIGAGVFGSWTAYLLQKAGAKVALIDAYGPGNSRSSSGGESRIIRFGYGADEIYTRSAQRSLLLWKELFRRASEVETQSLFHETGVLWLAREADRYCEATLSTLERAGAKCERLTCDDLTRRYPQLNFREIHWGILEPEAGIVIARRAVKAVCAAAQSIGVTYLQKAIAAPTVSKRLESVTTTSDENIHAEKFVFACGPWLPKLFPYLLSERFQISRQEVFFFGTPAGDERFNSPQLPAWIDFSDLVYGIPNIESRGFKVAIDAHGADFDPDSSERLVSGAGCEATRNYLKIRVPAMANAPIIESRVCQYENTSSGDFLIDAHPDFGNVWLVGGGSGHGFKHGPAVGEYVVGMIAGEGFLESRFSLATKNKVQQRTVF